MNKHLRKILRRTPRAFQKLLPAHDQLAILRRGNADRMLVLVPAHRILYTVVPKAANSTIKRYLWAACGEVVPAEEAMLTVQHERGPVRLPSDYSSAELQRILGADDWFRFSFVRNPYSRLVSVYKDKILALGHFDSGLTFHRRVDSGAEGPLPFKNFIETVCSQSDDQMNVHWRPQAPLLMEAAIAYSHIGRVESFHEDMRPVIDRLQLPHDIAGRLEGEAINRTATAPQSGPFAPQFDAGLAEQVFERYRGDFERFGYEPHSWKAWAQDAA